MSLSEMKAEIVSSIAKDDAEKAKCLLRAFDYLVKSWHPIYDLLCQALTSKDPEICNNYVVSKLIESGAPVNCLCSHGYSPLFYAVKGDRTDIFKLLLDSGADPNAAKKPPPPGFCDLGFENRPMTNGSSLLHIAAYNKNEEIVKLLLDHDVKPAVDEFGVSPLHYAARSGSLPIVTAILNSGCEKASMNLPDFQEKLTPLHLAVIKDHEDVVSLLLERGFYDDRVCKNGFKPTHTAAGVGNKRVVELLLKHCQVKNKEDWLEGFIAMYLAAFYGHAEVVRMFLDLGVDPNARFEDYLTPLHAAASGGHTNILALLLESGADLKSRTFPPLFQAVIRGHEEVVEFLLDSGADLHTKLQNVPAIKRATKSKLEEMLTCDSIFHDVEKGVCTPIHCAASIGSASIVKLLLKRGADVNAKSNLNNTPLFFAVCMEHEEVVACLLEAGADVEAGAVNHGSFFTAILTRNLGIVQLLFKHIDPLKLAASVFLEDSLTPLQYAVKVQSTEIVDFFLKNGEPVNHYIQKDFPLHSAVALRNQEIVSKLIAHGAHLDHVCSNGVTALFHAIMENDLDMCKLLIRKGASLNQLAADGSSLLHYAIYKRLDKKVIKFLVECGADLTLVVDQFLPVEYLIYCAMEDYLDQMKRGKTESIKANNEIVAILKLFLEHGSPLTKEFAHSILHSWFTVFCDMGYVTGIKLLIICDTDFHDGLSVFRGTYGTLIARLDTLNRRLIERNVNNVSPDCLCRDYNEVTKFREKCDNYREIGQLLTQWIARKESGGMELKEEHLWLIWSAFPNFYAECREEIRRMKDMLISGRVTFFDLWRASEEKLAAYARNEDIVEAVTGLDLEKLFPIYSEDLTDQIRRGVNMSNLLGMSLRVLNKIYEITIPSLIADEIFKYVTSTDLRNLCRVYNPFAFVSADSPDLQFRN